MYWVKELDGSFEQYNWLTIQETMQPGEWSRGPNNQAIWHCHPKP